MGPQVLLFIYVQTCGLGKVNVVFTYNQEGRCWVMLVLSV